MLCCSTLRRRQLSKVSKNYSGAGLSKRDKLGTEPLYKGQVGDWSFVLIQLSLSTRDKFGVVSLSTRDKFGVGLYRSLSTRDKFVVGLHTVEPLYKGQVWGLVLYHAVEPLYKGQVVGLHTVEPLYKGQVVGLHTVEPLYKGQVGTSWELFYSRASLQGTSLG